MDLLQLRYFFESADNENFSHTAARHTVPPSTVSASVRRLEDELGCKLFYREGNRIRLNQYGQRLYDAMKTVFYTLDSTVDNLQNKSSELTGEVNLLVRTDRSVIYRAVNLFLSTNPNVTFHISHNFDSNFASKYDMIIDEIGEKYSGYKSVPFFSENLKFAVSVNNDLANKKISFNSLKNQRFISLSKNSSLGKQLKSICQSFGFTPDIRIECDDPLYLLKYVADGMGITLIPEKSWENQINNSIAFLNISDFHAKRHNCIYIKDGYSGKATDTFCNFLLKSEI